jgi:hypothetical protein
MRLMSSHPTRTQLMCVDVVEPDRRGTVGRSSIGLYEGGGTAWVVAGISRLSVSAANYRVEMASCLVLICM